MTDHEPHRPSRRLTERVAGSVGGLIGLALWYVLWQSFISATSSDELADLASGPAFVLLVTTSAIGCILLIGIPAGWLISWARGSSRSRA
jgi:cell division protein FtsX